MKFFQEYGWNDASDFFISLAPSFKYHLGFISMTVSAVWATIQLLMGFTNYSMIAFAALAFLELASGLYASVVVKKNRLESHKMGRFLIKLAIMLICLFVLGTFAKENEGTFIGTIFQWMRDGVFGFTVFEYLVSVLENVAVITGKSENRLLLFLKSKMDEYFPIKKTDA